MNLTTRKPGVPIGPTHPWFSGGQVHLEHTPRKGLFQHIFEMCVFLALFLQSLDHVLASRAAFTHPGPGHKYLRARNVLACVHVAFVLDDEIVDGPVREEREDHGGVVGPDASNFIDLT